METLDALLPHNAGERKTLADLIFAKLDSGEVSSAAVIQKVHQSVYLAHITRYLQFNAFVQTRRLLILLQVSTRQLLKHTPS